MRAIFKDDNLSESTLSTRIKFIDSVLDYFPENQTNFSFLDDTNRVDARINESENYLTIFNRYNIIVKSLEAEKKLLKKLSVSEDTMNYYNNQLTRFEQLKIQRVNDNRATQTQLDHFVPLEDLQKTFNTKVNELRLKYKIKGNNVNQKDINRLREMPNNGDNLYKYGKELQSLMIIAMYVHQPALRDDFGMLKFSSSVKNTANTNFNYFKHDAGFNNTFLYMNVFKNSASYVGTQVIDFYYGKHMQNWYKFLTLVLGKKPEYMFLYAFEAVSKKIYHTENKSGLSTRVKRDSLAIFGKQISINMYRHIWEHSFQTDPFYADRTILEKERLHQTMLHTHSTAQRYNLLMDHPDGVKQ